MFGSKKKTEEAAKLGRDIAEMAFANIRRYCDRVVYFRASQILRQLTDALDEFPDDQPANDEINAKRAIVFSSFQIHLHDALAPLQLQLTEQIDADFGYVFAREDDDLRQLFLKYIQERFDEQYDRIADAGRYIAGLAETYISQLLDDPEDEAKTPSA